MIHTTNDAGGRRESADSGAAAGTAVGAVRGAAAGGANKLVIAAGTCTTNRSRKHAGENIKHDNRGRQHWNIDWTNMEEAPVECEYGTRTKI